jgi:hypothetical protein
MRNAPLLLILAAVGAAGAASAAQKRQEPSYQAPSPTIVATPLAVAIAGFDRDGDMIVSRAEFEAGVARSLAMADANKDARVSLIELADWSEAALGNRGALPGQFDFDRDGDDSISRDEFTGLFETRFASLDKDTDKALRRSELVTFALVPASRQDRRRGGEFREPAPR